MFPYVILTILACKALSLEGAFEGIKFLFTPDWDRLTYRDGLKNGPQVARIFQAS